MRHDKAHSVDWSKAPFSANVALEGEYSHYFWHVRYRGWHIETFYFPPTEKQLLFGKPHVIQSQSVCKYNEHGIHRRQWPANQFRKYAEKLSYQELYDLFFFTNVKHARMFKRRSNHPVTAETIEFLIEQFPDVFVEEDEPEETTESTVMNLNNAALIVREDIKTVSVTFNNEPDSDYTYVLHDSIHVEINDRVLVPTTKANKTTLHIGVVTEIHAEPQIELNSNKTYRWVLANVENAVNTMQAEIDSTALMAKALKQRQASNVREQILKQYGVDNSQELLRLVDEKA